jgi:pimeloyl-ACP methyl ester carboxylesterase
MSRRLGADGRRRMAELHAALEATSDPGARDDLLAQRGALATQAQSVALIEPNKSDLSADALGHEETWNDVLRRQDEGIEPRAFAAIATPVLMIHGDDDPHPGAAIRDLDLAGKDSKQRALSAFGNGELSGTEVEVRGRASESFQLGGRQSGKQRNCRDVVDRQQDVVFGPLPFAAP